MKKKAQKKKALKTKKPKSKMQKLKVAKKKTDSFTLNFNEQVWPCERDVLFRPDRFKYVRKLISPSGCVFCESAKNQVRLETLCVYQTKYSMVVLNKFPYNSGHILILPQRHCGDMLELTQEEYYDLQDLLRVALKSIQEIYKPGGVNIGLNLGSVAGAGIPDHLHYHLIPRWAGDLNFFPLVAETKVVIESLEMSFNRLVEYFKQLKR